MEKLKLSVTLNAAPKKVYDAWLNSKAHSAFIGDKATASTKVKGKFTAWGDYITGVNIDLKAGKKIVQAWRTTEFPEGALDSILEVKLDKAVGGKTKLTITQINIPTGQAAKYKNGWKTHYFESMKKYFSEKK